MHNFGADHILERYLQGLGHTGCTTSREVGEFQYHVAATTANWGLPTPAR